MTDTDPQAVMRRYLDALVAGDIETIRDSFQPDATWWIHGDLPISRTWRGRDAIVDDFLLEVGPRFEPGSQRFEFSDPVVDGKTVVLEWRVRGRSAAGVPYDNAYCGVFELGDGRIAAVREYMDTQHAAEVLFA